MKDRAPKSNTIRLSVLPGRLAVCRLAPGAALPTWAKSSSLLALVQTPEEVSIVCDESCVPPDVRTEPGWIAWKVHGPLDFALIGVLAGIANTLAEAQVSIFVVSTYDTDYVLVKEEDLIRSRSVLEVQGYLISDRGEF